MVSEIKILQYADDDTTIFYKGVGTSTEEVLSI